MDLTMGHSRLSHAMPIWHTCDSDVLQTPGAGS